MVNKNGVHKYIGADGRLLLKEYKEGTLLSEEESFTTNIFSYLNYIGLKEKLCSPINGKPLEGFHKVNSKYGESYEGTYSNGLPEGKGKYTSPIGYYEGEAKNGEAEGFGKNVKKNKYEYEGMFHKNKRHGYGECWFHNGSQYKGQWKRDQMSGRGEWTGSNQLVYHGIEDCEYRYHFDIKEHKDGKKYTGNWENNNMEGFGILSYQNGKAYQGYFKHKGFEGIEILDCNFKDAAKGRWVKKPLLHVLFEKDFNKDQGPWQQLLYFQDGSLMLGNYKNGKEEGVHKYIDNDGQMFDFEYKNGILMAAEEVPETEIGKEVIIDNESFLIEDALSDKNLNGFFKTFDGYRIYKGNWKNRKKDGYMETEGIHDCGGKEQFKGMFENNLKDREGVWYKETEGRYDGHWKDGKKWGIGTYTWKGGVTLYGNWENDEKVYDAEFTIGRKYKYVGNFDFEISLGVFELLSSDGMVYKNGEIISSIKKKTWFKWITYFHWFVWSENEEDSDNNGMAWLRGIVAFPDGTIMEGNYKIPTSSHINWDMLELREIEEGEHEYTDTDGTKIIFTYKMGILISTEIFEEDFKV